MADVDLVENLDGYQIPIDPINLLQCDSCQ